MEPSTMIANMTPVELKKHVRNCNTLLQEHIKGVKEKMRVKYTDDIHIAKQRYSNEIIIKRRGNYEPEVCIEFYTTHFFDAGKYDGDGDLITPDAFLIRKKICECKQIVNKFETIDDCVSMIAELYSANISNGVRELLSLLIELATIERA